MFEECEDFENPEIPEDSVIDAIYNLIQTIPSLSQRKINVGLTTEKYANTTIETHLELGEILADSPGEILPCPIIAIFRDKNDSFAHQFNNMFLKETCGIKIEVCYEDKRLKSASTGAKKMAYALKKLIDLNPTLLGTVFMCFCSNVEKLGLRKIGDNPYQYGFKLHLDFKLNN